VSAIASRHRFIASAHIATMVCGAGMCVAGSEGIGILLLCASMVFLTAVCVSDLQDAESPLTSAGYGGGLETRVAAAEQSVTTMSRRSRGIAELLGCVESTPACEHLNIDTRLKWVLDHIESDDTHVDSVLHALRDDVVGWTRAGLSTPHH
jgi:hypothetical protein